MQQEVDISARLPIWFHSVVPNGTAFLMNGNL
jgi:hypothetical protein